jgi:hypothetical protein
VRRAAVKSDYFVSIRNECTGNCLSLSQLCLLAINCQNATLLQPKDFLMDTDVNKEVTVSASTFFDHFACDWLQRERMLDFKRPKMFVDIVIE